MEFLSKENSQYYHWLPIFTVMLGTGMRVGEITGLRWNDIDLKSGIIDVNHTLVYYKHRDENGCYFDISFSEDQSWSASDPYDGGSKECVPVREKNAGSGRNTVQSNY